MSEKVHSDLLKFITGIDHGFLTRAWGGDPAKGIPTSEICRMKQVHGSSILHVRTHKDIERARETEADITITNLSDVAITVSTADCVPLLFCDPIKNVIAASHAGWRGTVKDVAGKTVQILTLEYSCDPKELVVAIGPCIHSCCYEVDRPVYEAIHEKDFLIPSDKKQDRWMLNLPQLNRYQLIKSGILDGNIEILPYCTACRQDLFYSYRKEGDTAGRQWSYISIFSI